MTTNLKLKIKNEKLSEDEVRHVAKLARLSLSSDEVKKFRKQLSEVLDYFEILRKINAKRIEPTSQVTGKENTFRNDFLKRSLSQQDVLSGSKDNIRGMFKVKAIFD